VLLGIVRAYLDLVRPARPEGRLGLIEELVMLRPRLHHLSVAVYDEDDVAIAHVARAGRRSGRRNDLRVWCPRLRALGKRQFAALRDPDTIRAFRVHRSL
jgi:hypothetical protein